MKTVSAVFLVLFAMSVTVSGAFAQVCSKDVEKFCAKVKPGEGRISQCLEQHEAQLSPACKTHRTQLKAAIKAAEQACKNEITKYCGGTQKGERRILECLSTNKPKLSSACKAKVVSAEAKSKE